jgi:GGDEF domain-containing protein
MLGLEDVTAWTAVGTSAFAALVVVLGLVLAVWWRRASERRLRTVHESAARSEEMLAELTGNLERVQSESEAAREQGERTEREAKRLRVLASLGATLELDEVASKALEQATEEVGADGSLVVLQSGEEEPYAACFGLSPTESERELVGLPPTVNEARAVTIRYRYSAEEIENDAFRLTGGLAVPLQTGGVRIGTLAVFWRRTAHDPTDEEIARLEDVAGLLAGPLDSARRFEEVRRVADLDPLTGLHNERYFADRLLREVARARRYDRRLALVLFHLDGATGAMEDAVVFGHHLRAAIRSADIPCYLGGGEFAVIAPEAPLTDAKRLAERMRFTASARPRGGGPGWIGLGIAELGEPDSAGSLLDRARAAARRQELDAVAAPSSVSGA